MEFRERRAEGKLWLARRRRTGDQKGLRVTEMIDRRPTWKSAGAWADRVDLAPRTQQERKSRRREDHVYQKDLKKRCKSDRTLQESGASNRNPSTEGQKGGEGMVREKTLHRIYCHPNLGKAVSGEENWGSSGVDKVLQAGSGRKIRRGEKADEKRRGQLAIRSSSARGRNRGSGLKNKAARSSRTSSTVEYPIWRR